MKKIILFLFVLGLLAAGFGVFKYFQPVPGISEQDADYTLSAAELYIQYIEDESRADSLYVRSILEVSGAVLDRSQEWKQVDGDSVFVHTILLDGGDGMAGVSCQLADVPSAEQWQNWKVGSPMVIKGECSGMLFDVVLSRCVVMN